jgi:hypothetical protein
MNSLGPSSSLEEDPGGRLRDKVTDYDLLLTSNESNLNSFSPGSSLEEDPGGCLCEDVTDNE